MLNLLQRVLITSGSRLISRCHWDIWLYPAECFSVMRQGQFLQRCCSHIRKFESSLLGNNIHSVVFTTSSHFTLLLIGSMAERKRNANEIERTDRILQRVPGLYVSKGNMAQCIENVNRDDLWCVAFIPLVGFPDMHVSFRCLIHPNPINKLLLGTIIVSRWLHLTERVDALHDQD